MSYLRTVALNQIAVENVLAHNATGDQDSLCEAFRVLKPVTRKEVRAVIFKLGLSYSSEEDMMQEAYVKFQAWVANFDYDRCPVIVTFWATSIRNHLLSKCRKDVPFASCSFDEIQDSTETSAKRMDRLFIQDLLDHYKKEFATWEAGYVKLIPFVVAILEERILVGPQEQVSQKVLEKRFSVSQGYVSKWETWLYEKIREEFPEGYEP